MEDVSQTMPTEPVLSPPPKRWATVLAILALFASGTGVGYLFTEPGAAPRTGQETVATPTAPGFQTGSEPIADVAEFVLPSIVQIQVGDRASGGVGSGVIYDSKGLIMTAAHVVDGFTEVAVRFYDGAVVGGTVMGADLVNDIAVVQVEKTDLRAAALALDERPRVGQLAIALGSPWGLDSTVTSGIVSAVDRPLRGADGADTRSMLQTDAAINPGNSGGPLVDRSGRVMGINVSIFTESGASDGVGFAVPIGRAVRVAKALEEGRQFVPGFLGVRGNNAPAGSDPGAVVIEVTPGSAAAAAGLEVGDLITNFDGFVVTGILDLAARVRDREAGETVELEVVRDGKTLVFEATLTDRLE